MAEEVVLTSSGKKKIEDELERLRSVEMPALAVRIREARDLGDLSENFDYQDAKRQQGFIGGRIADLQAMLERAVIVENVEPGSGIIGMGSKVTVRDTDYDDEFSYTFVSSNEVDPINDKISIVNPVGAALMGKRVGESVVVTTPDGAMNLEILAIE
jgi:transcription elongation factor GreA